MRKLMLLLSILSLLATIVPSILVFKQIMDPEQNKLLMSIGTLGWFVTAPFWIRSKTM